MIGGRSGNVVAIRPLRHGVMTEFDITQRMIEVVLRRVGVSRFPKPRVLACVASESSEVERRAVREAVRFAGGRDVVLVEEPLAAAVGARLPIHEPIGNLIVDIGGGMTEMAVVSMGGVVSGGSTRLGGFDLDAAIQDHLRRAYDVAIGEKSAEEIKIAIGSAFPAPRGRAAIVTGQGARDGRAHRDPRHRGRDPAGDVRTRPPDRRGRETDDRRGAPRAHPRRARGGDVPHRWRRPAPGARPAPVAGVRGAGAPDRTAARDRRPRPRRRCSNTSTTTGRRSSSCASADRHRVRRRAR